MARSVGVVSCIANDIPQSHPYDTGIAGPLDTQTPAQGRAYFYLARANGAPYGGDGYGAGSTGVERVPTAGDCLR